MMDPAAAARAIVRWYEARSPQQVLAEAPLLDATSDPVVAADVLGTAADSADEEERAAGIVALFGGVVEPLNDGFEPAARALYARVFGRVVWACCQRHDELAAALAAAGIDSEAALLARHARLRAGVEPVATGEPRRIAVLSRVTLGADILLTSVVLQRLHQRWPAAELVVLGDPKLAGLLGGLPAVRIEPLRYTRRGPLGERLRSWLALRAAVAQLAPDLVVGPDSRLDQLGLLPVVDQPGRYLLWENVQPEATRPRSLATLVDAWCAGRLDLTPIPACRPRVAFDATTAALHQRWHRALGGAPVAAVKLDHGGNPNKTLPRATELALLRELTGLGWRILLDYGFGDEELAASDALVAALGWRPAEVDDSGRGGRPLARLEPGDLGAADVVRFHGSIAGWAAGVAACGLAVSYDSVGHHLAAALGVPLVSLFTGFEHDAFPVAWQPVGPGAVQQVVIPTAQREDPGWMTRISAALPSAPAAR